MPTRLKRPSIWRQLAVSTVLVAVQGYLAFNVVSGQFGINSQRQLHLDIGELNARSAALAAEIEAYQHRAALFAPQKLDPDIVSERARALLSVAQSDDVIVMIGEKGEPIYGSSGELADNELTDLITGSIGQ